MPRQKIRTSAVEQLAIIRLADFCFWACDDNGVDCRGCGRNLESLEADDCFVYLFDDGAWHAWSYSEMDPKGTGELRRNGPQFCAVCHYSGIARVLLDPVLTARYELILPVWASVNKAAPIWSALSGNNQKEEHERRL